METEHQVSLLEERLVVEGRDKHSHSQRTFQLATDTVEQIQVHVQHVHAYIYMYILSYNIHVVHVCVYTLL